MKKNYIYIANWKMYWSFNQTLGFVKQHYKGFNLLANQPNTSIVICPSSTVISSLAQMMQGSGIAVGAQDCSANLNGAFTGQVSAESIHEAGASFCIIGHSERRCYNGETDHDVAAKFLRLLEAHVIPIVCIGETQKQHQENMTLVTLEEQLKLLVNALTHNAPLLKNSKPIVAYEPVWAIGTGLIPSKEHLEKVFAWLKAYLNEKTPNAPWSLLYGGSTSSKNIESLKENIFIDGFLIGGASLDFQEFEKIVLSDINI